MDPDVLGDFVADWSAKEAEGFLNGAIANLAANGAYGRWVRVVMDGSHLHTTPCFEYTHKHWGGLKLLLLWDAFSGLPLAAKVVGKDTYEPAWTLSLLRQAERNLGEHSRIGEFVADRLYVNGKLLHALDQKDIVFTIRAKAGMAIREDALSMVAAGSGNRQRRGTKEDTVKVVGLEGLNTYDDYNDAEAARHKNRKDYEAQPLNAVVVLASPQMPQDGEPWVLLTNGSVKQPLDGLILSNAVRSAVIGLAKTLSQELAPLGITVNNVCPGRILTDRLRTNMETRARESGLPVEEVLANAPERDGDFIVVPAIIDTGA